MQSPEVQMTKNSEGWTWRGDGKEQGLDKRTEWMPTAEGKVQLPEPGREHRVDVKGRV